MIQYGLPERVVLPTERIFPDGRFLGYWKYVRGTLEELKDQVKLEYSERLGKRGWSSFEILVDDQPVIIDYSDFALVDPASSAFAHWLRFQYTSALAPFPNFGSFPPWSFLDWTEYRRMLCDARYTALGESVIFRHSSLTGRMPNLVQRRTRALELLERSCGDRLRTGFLPQQAFFQECVESLAVVHIPGSHPHILDRTVQQMFALGVCVISPDLWTSCLDERPQMGRHYVGILDDFSDLPEKVKWVSEHREEAVKIGQAARAFFERNCTPPAIWHSVHTRVSASPLSRQAVHVSAPEEIKKQDLV